MATKKERRAELQKSRKRNHLIDILYVLADRGIRLATARQIAKESLYVFSTSFVNELNDMADDGLIRMHVYIYRTKGPCQVRYKYALLPESAGPSRPKKLSKSKG